MKLLVVEDEPKIAAARARGLRQLLVDRGSSALNATPAAGRTQVGVCGRCLRTREALARTPPGTGPGAAP